jgi:probable addiction module antidote protein
VSEIRIDYGPGYRVYFAEREGVVIILLRGGTKKTQQEDIREAKRLYNELKKMIKTLPYDSAEYLKDPETMQHYMDEALATGDTALIAHALGVVARAKGMADIANKAGLSRESLYRTLSANGRPEFSTVVKVLAALDLRLLTAKAPSATKKKRVYTEVRYSPKKKTARRKEMSAGRRAHA